LRALGVPVATHGIWLDDVESTPKYSMVFRQLIVVQLVGVDDELVHVIPCQPLS
jgi:hypothetical protein